MKIRVIMWLFVICYVHTAARQDGTLWKAFWITGAGSNTGSYEVFHFRKDFNIPVQPKHCLIKVSADARYKLYCNGIMLGLGPAKSDLNHWNYEVYDIGPYLKKGRNIISSVVWNDGDYNPYAQMYHKTAFILQGDSALNGAVDTNESWLALKDSACHPVVFKHNDSRLLWQYYVAGALDSIEGAKYPWDWNTSLSVKGWSNAVSLVEGCPDGVTNPGFLTLQQRAIPLPEYIYKPFKLPKDITTTSIAANTTYTFMIDNGILTTGYPSLSVSGGKGSKIRLLYAESPIHITSAGWHKNNRNNVTADSLIGVYDVFKPDGGRNRNFTPLWFRTFRYIQVAVSTADEPIQIDSLSYFFSAYPFQKAGNFATKDSMFNRIDEVAYHTVRLCASETYMDCPYYEQLQYIGDARIQALYWYNHSPDQRLTKNAIEQFSWSQRPDGLTMSRYPSALTQYTPLYSLCWALMVRDYWMYGKDRLFAAKFMPAVISVFHWFEQQQNAEGMLGQLPYLDFIDSHFDQHAVLSKSHSKSIVTSTLFFAYTIQQLLPVLEHFNYHTEVVRYRLLANQLIQRVNSLCFNTEKGLYAENADQRSFTVHANVMAVLTGCIKGKKAIALLHKITQDTSLLPCDLYFKFYQFEAFDKAGIGNEILGQLGDWQYMIEEGLSTFSEWKVDPRSDCHGWSAYPAYFFLKSVAGIAPGSPGFDTVIISPRPGMLQTFTATVPWHSDAIKETYTVADNGMCSIFLDLPATAIVIFKWQGEVLTMHGGKHVLHVKSPGSYNKKVQ